MAALLQALCSERGEGGDRTQTETGQDRGRECIALTGLALEDIYTSQRSYHSVYWVSYKNNILAKNSFFTMVILPPHLHLAGTAHCVTVEEQSSNPRHNIIE